MTKNPAAELARKRAAKIGPDNCSAIASLAAQSRWDAEGRRKGLQFYTYFVCFDGRYLKVGSSYSPLNRSWYYSKHPEDLDLHKATRQWIGCAYEKNVPESAMFRQLQFALVDNCREWFHWTPEVEAIVNALPFVEPPRRVQWPAEKKETRAAKRAGKRSQPSQIENTAMS